jgi:hypothetical protein
MADRVYEVIPAVVCPACGAAFPASRRRVEDVDGNRYCSVMRLLLADERRRSAETTVPEVSAN